MTTNCPACGAFLDVTLTPAIDPNAPVPQPVPAPSQPPTDLAGQVYREQDGRWVPTVPGDPSQLQVGPNVFVAHDGTGQPLRAGEPRP